MWLAIREFIKDSITWIGIFIGMFIFIIYVLTFTQVVGPSMEPGLKDKDVVVIFKFISNVKRGDIVTHKYANDQIFIKRIVGLPNDKVEIRDGLIYINDELFIEDYIDSKNNTKVLNKKFDIVPEGSYLVLGDNRDNSKDSRHIDVGFIKKESITGKVIFKFFPFNRLGIVK